MIAYVYIYTYIYTRIFGPRFARPRFFAVPGLSVNVFKELLETPFSVFLQPQSTTISRCCLYFADFRALDPQSGGKRCTETSNDTEKVAQGSEKGNLMECVWSFVGLMSKAICQCFFKGAPEGALFLFLCPNTSKRSSLGIHVRTFFSSDCICEICAVVQVLAGFRR